MEADESLLQQGLSVEVDVTGTAWHLGVDMLWRLSFSTDGSFKEDLSSPQTSYSSGYDATGSGTGPDGYSSQCSSADSSSSHTLSSTSTSTSTSTSSGGSTGSMGSGGCSGSSYFSAPGICWASDDAGCPRRMQLDDEEALLLSTWLRAGMWVLPAVAKQLHITQVPAPSSSGGDDDGSGGSGGGGSSWLELRLRGGGQVAAYVELCTASWRPLSAQLRLAGESEVWSFSHWREWQPGLWLAAQAVQTNSGGGGPSNEYKLQSAVVQEVAPAAAADHASDSGAASGNRFAPPPAPLLPGDSIFLPGVKEEVPAWHTVSGHCLVKPQLDGRDVGFFILDTGASGFVVEPSVADSLGLEAFGELQVISMVGRIASRFRRAQSLQLGALRMLRPLFMELPCSGIVSGVPDGGRVVGIIGYDLLRRAVVTMPPHPRRPELPPSATAGVDSPAAAVAAAASAARMRNGPLPLTIRLQHPAALEPGRASRDGAAEQRGSGSSSSNATAGSAPGLALASPSTAAAAAAVSSPATASSSAAVPTPVPSSSSNSGTGSSSSAGNSTSSSSGGSRAAYQRQHPLRRLKGALGREQPLSEPQWLPLVMVSSLPHIELELVTAEGCTHRGLFMMDSGAGGFDLIIGARAAQSMQLGAAAAANAAGGSGGVTQIKGVGSGTGEDRITARRCQLAEVRLGHWHFSGVQALFHAAPPKDGGGGGAGLELSQHTSGIVCAGLLGRCGLTFDYARMRVGVAGPQ